MIHAYEDSYLPDAQASLADYFDYVINGCGIDPDMAGALFAQSEWGGSSSAATPRWSRACRGRSLPRRCPPTPFS